MSTEKTNILLVDDHSMVIEGMKSILAQMPLVQVKATAGNAFEAIAALRENKIDIAFVDINLPDISGIELCTKIKNEFPDVHVLGLSTFKQRSYVSQMIANGASGYLLKSAGKEEIEEAIAAILSGKMYFSADINNTKAEPVSEDKVPTLTRREKEILQLIAEGLTTNQIADKIFVSHYTVETHRKNLLSKFEVGNSALLIKTAVQFGLL
jgi:two-component system, NarL family, nitrate/nitrite response regulator NarL